MSLVLSATCTQMIQAHYSISNFSLELYTHKTTAKSSPFTYLPAYDSPHKNGTTVTPVYKPS